MLRPARLAFSVAIGLLVGACSTTSVSPDETLTPRTEAQTVAEFTALTNAPTAEARSSGISSTINDLMECAPLPAASTTRLIGPAGGTIAVGPHRLVIPPRALRRSVSITASVLPDSSASLQFAPEGLTFAANARPWLELSYAHCNLLLGALLPKRVAYVRDDLTLIEALRSFDLPLTRKVYSPLDHFSRYAVAW